MFPRFIFLLSAESVLFMVRGVRRYMYLCGGRDAIIMIRQTARQQSTSRDEEV